jgi:DNA-binding XRE family transcriptional regulator
MMRIVERNGYRVAYDPETPAVSVRWAEPPFAFAKEMDDARHVDYGRDGEPAGVAFLYVDEGVDLRGVPRAREVASLLEEVGVRVAHGPEVDEAPALARVLAEALIRYRAHHGLSLRALAVKLGVQHPTVVRLERGVDAPDVGTLVRVADALGIRFLLQVAPSPVDALLIPDGSIRATEAVGRVSVVAVASGG